MLVLRLDVLLIVGLVAAHPVDGSSCSELGPTLEIPCECRVDAGGSQQTISVNCDNVVFQDDIPLFPFKMPITEYRQRHAGLQGLASQLFTASQLPLKTLDFSYNSIRKLNGKVFEGLETHLETLLLNNNKLGDVYTQRLSLPEVAKLNRLKVLNLGNNEIQEIDNALLRNLTNLKVLQLEGNFFIEVPTTAMQGLEQLKVLTLQENDIDYLASNSFSTTPQLVFLNVSRNQISVIEGSAFGSLQNLTALDLSHNRLTSAVTESFENLEMLETLDLSSNFFNEIPANALKDLRSLKTLQMENNRIQTLGGIVALGPAATLRTLDLRRNNIVNLESKTFKRLSGVLTLKLSVNSVGKKNNYAFEGLDSLENLELDDHRFFSFPSTMLAMTPSLKSLSLNYNRIRVLTAASLQVVKDLRVLSLAGNIITEILPGTFQNFTKLRNLNLNSNKITTLSPESFSDISRTLQELDLGNNLLSELSQFDFPQLTRLILSGNKLVTLTETVFLFVPEIQNLDLSKNNMLAMPKKSFDPLSKLGTLNLSFNKLRKIGTGDFNGTALSVLNLRSNQIQEIESKAFANLFLLTSLDLSNNKIEKIQEEALFDTTFLHILNLKNNKLTSFKRNLFGFPGLDTTQLRYIDLSDNDITFIQDDAFQSHPRVLWLSLSKNRLTFFPAAAFRDMPHINQLDLSRNHFERVSHGDFANNPMLRTLDFSSNTIAEVSENAFQNSTQLQKLNLSHNKINTLFPDSFQGIGRLQLDLSYNNLTSLPDSLFDRTKLKLISLNLAHNYFKEVPVKALRSQYYFFTELLMAHNNISNIPNNADVLVNIKSLDLSYNPLTTNDVLELLNEPKLLRKLNIAGTKIKEVPLIEARFLISLNLSDNSIIEVTDKTFKLTHNLRSLDLSSNLIPNVHIALASSWPELPNLKLLDLSKNPIAYIVRDDFKGLSQLKILKMSQLPRLKRIDPTSFRELQLEELELYGIPMADKINVRSILDNTIGMEKIDIQLSGEEVDNDLRGAFSPRLKRLIIRGENVKEIKSSAFLNLNSPVLHLGIINTNLSHLDDRILFLVPMSSNIDLDLSNNRIQSLSEKFMEDAVLPRKDKLTVKGLDSNPLYCDCHIKALRAWIIDNSDYRSSSLSNATCNGPKHLTRAKIVDLSPSQLICTHPTAKTNNLNDIITKDELDRKNIFKGHSGKSSNKDIKFTSMDKIIIGVVAGVIGFVALLILLVCCIRMLCNPNRRDRNNHFHGPAACTCVKPALSRYYNPYTFTQSPGSRAGTLKSLSPTTPLPTPFSTLGAQSRAAYYNGPLSYMGSYQHDEHDYR